MKTPDPVLPHPFQRRLLLAHVALALIERPSTLSVHQRTLRSRLYDPRAMSHESLFLTHMIGHNGLPAPSTANVTRTGEPRREYPDHQRAAQNVTGFESDPVEVVQRMCAEINDRPTVIPMKRYDLECPMHFDEISCREFAERGGWKGFVDRAKAIGYGAPRGDAEA